ncbi:hypothetical protein GGU10DRAFT_342566 [Lentinula aff. detonsa]|uniref:BAG domain-containing protein n=1 Tax=Lentinula aff. detonsa TaxID=2804958 RepID=A0AA38NRA1_9AGAR|nr:hypothetical protein GGU10DRAFT_342566 [Lentinula aff. detonsa]
MYRYQPAYISALPTDLGYSRPQYSRPTYASPFAEQLRAAEAQREEEELLRRLEEIRFQKQQDRFRRHFPYDSYTPYHSSYLEDDELERSAAFRRRQQQQQFELEYLRRKQEEEARLLALKRAEEELKLQQLARLREQEEARVAALQRESEQANAARHNRSRKGLPCYLQDNSDDTQLCQLFGPQAQHQRPHIVRRSSSDVKSEPQTLEQLLTDFVKQLRDGKPVREQTPKPVREEPQTKAPSPAPREAVASPRNLEEVLRLMFNPQPHISNTVPEKVASPSKPVAQVCPLFTVNRIIVLSNIALQEKPKTIEITEPHPVSGSDSRPVSALSLKEQLEARLNNDQSNEIKDTIQAILASLSNPTASPTPPSASETSPNNNSKGKGKAPEPQPNLTPISGDAHKALESVRAIEASLVALQDEFEFPSDVDFSPAPSRSSSPVRDDVSYTSEFDTPTLRKLAYTARNHPIRSYEQALSRLLVQLDEIESHGNADVRNSRKAVVARVEGALEELEQKVEARWNKRTRDHRVEREEEAEKKGEDTEAPMQERQVTSAQDDFTATSQPEVATAQRASDATVETISASDSTLEESTETLPQRPSYAEVAKHQTGASADPKPFTTPESDASPATEVAESTDAAFSDSNAQGEEHTEELNVFSTEVSVVEPLPQTENDSVSGTETEVEATSASIEPEVSTVSLSSSLSSSSQSQVPEESYRSVYSDASVDTIRPSELPSIPGDKLESDVEQLQASEDGHSNSSQESEAEVLVDTFLLSKEDTAADDIPFKQSELDLEDAGSDWSEVEA